MRVRFVCVTWLVLSPSVALAETCEEFSSVYPMPHSGWSAIPRNVRPLVMVYNPEARFYADPVLYTADPVSEVAVELGYHTQGDWTVLTVTPVELLVPEKAYVLDLNVYGGGGYGQGVELTPSDELDTAAPQADAILSATAHAWDTGDSGAYGESAEYIQLELDRTNDQEDYVVHEIQASQETDFSAPLTAYEFYYFPAIGDVHCYTRNMDLVWGETWHIRRRAVDLAANAGPWSNVVTVVTEVVVTGVEADKDGAGCGCGSSRAGLLGLSLALLPAARARRRRRASVRSEASRGR